MPSRADFRDILPLLVSTYRQGRLVPFLGAGMSAPTLTLWKEFVSNLEAQARLCQHTSEQSPDWKVNSQVGAAELSLDARAQRACTIIQNTYGWDHFPDAVRNALKTPATGVPKSTTALAQIRWPLALSTNYDDLFYYACRCRHNGNQQNSDEMRVQVLGRSAKDCKLIISSLTGPFDRQYIWHVQGFLGGQSPDSNLAVDFAAQDLKALEHQLVIGHSDYRRVTNRAPEFRRCFTEVFNTRSFLFLGSSLKEDYFLNLFGEVLDLCGPSAVPHFAFAKQGEVDPSFLADQMNITVCELPKDDKDWQELPNWLTRLKEEIDMPRARSIRWSFAIGPDADSQHVASDLEIVRGLAPEQPDPGEAVAFVTPRDKDGAPVPLDQFEDLADKLKPTDSEHVFEYPNHRLYAVTARCRGNDDDTAVNSAVDALLDRVVKNNPNTTTLHFQFSGESGSVPPIYGFIEVIRSFREWRARKQKHNRVPLRLLLYVQSDVEFCLTSGRIDIPELLSSSLIRFWVVIVPTGGQEPIRHAMHCCPSTRVGEVLKEVGVPPCSDRWSLSLCPSPRKEPLNSVTSNQVHDRTIVQIGIAFGSVVILECDRLPEPAK